MDLDHEGDMEGSNQDTVKDMRMDACDFDGEILKCKSPNFPPNKQITNLYVQNLESLGKYFDNQLVAISLVGIKSSIYTRKRSWSGSGGWLSWRGTTPGARIMARGRRRITASLGTTVGKDKISTGYLNLQVAGEGHEAHVQEQQLA